MPVGDVRRQLVATRHGQLVAVGHVRLRRRRLILLQEPLLHEGGVARIAHAQRGRHRRQTIGAAETQHVALLRLTSPRAGHERRSRGSRCGGRARSEPKIEDDATGAHPLGRDDIGPAGAYEEDVGSLQRRACRVGRLSVDGSERAARV